MIILTYGTWFEFARQLHHDYETYHFNIEGILQSEFQAKVRPLPEKYMLEFEITFDDPKLETLFALKYSEYL